MNIEGKQILFYFQNLYPCNTGGMEIYNYHLIKKLLNDYPNNKWVVLTSCDKHPVTNNIKWLPLRNRLFIVKRYGLGSLSTIIFYTFSQKIKWINVKTVVVPYTSKFSYQALAFLILKALFKVEYVVHIHGGGIYKWKFRWLQKRFFKNARNIAGVSYPIVKEYSKRIGRNINYLPPLLPFETSKKSIDHLRQVNNLVLFEKIILFVGSIKKIKDPETLIKAFNNLGSDFIKYNKVGLVIVGEGPHKNILQEYYVYNKNIIFTGLLRYEEIKDYYALADIYVIPSWFEGTPISLIEAMFNKLTCVGSNVPGIKEIIEHGVNGYLFEKCDHIGLSNILKMLLEDNYDSLGKGSMAYKTYSEKFKYDNHLLDYIKFIES
jgi:glycosyltransferase involved in cell wall biosynthesis